MTRALLRSINQRVLVESHRGAEFLAPANSLRAVQIGQQRGADWIEVDAQLSADGVAFLRHNYSLPDGPDVRTHLAKRLPSLGCTVGPATAIT